MRRVWVAGAGILAAAAVLAGCGSSSSVGPIVFSGMQPGGARHLYVVNPDGSRLRQLTRTSGDADPTWSPSGKQIAFKRWDFASCARPHHDCAQIWVVNAGGSGAHPITPLSHRAEQPSWSPTGNRIAFVRWQDDANPFADNTEIYTMRPDGSDVRRLTDSPGDDESPAWSPDGKQLVFLSDRGGSYGIYVMRADGSHVRQLTHTKAPVFSPSWSPDGKLIAFEDADSQLVVMNADGNDQRVLAYTFAGAGRLAWSPDSKQISFLRGGLVGAQLYVVRVDGMHTRKLDIGTVGSPTGPSWAAASASG